jgi:predicted nucleic-acid-binding protein
MNAVDTNVLVRLLARDDATQVTAAEAFVAGGAWVSMLVLMETGWVLSSVYGLGHRELAVAIGMLLDHDRLSLEAPGVVLAALEQYRKRPSLGFSDCLILESAREAGHLPFGTFDANLAKIAGAKRLK